MKIHLRHLGYTLLLVTAFLNFWFYRFNLHESFFGDNECSSYNPCMNNPNVGVEPFEGFEEKYGDTRNAETGHLISLGFHLSEIDRQIFWIEMFLTAMLDTISIALALALIFHPEKNTK